MLANLLAFTSAYFSESRLFNGLCPIEIMKSGLSSQVVYKTSQASLPAAFPSTEPMSRQFDPATEKSVAHDSVLRKGLQEIFVRRPVRGGRREAAPSPDRRSFGPLRTRVGFHIASMISRSGQQAGQGARFLTAALDIGFGPVFVHGQSRVQDEMRAYATNPTAAIAPTTLLHFLRSKKEAY